jgi:hypothetical protein
MNLRVVGLWLAQLRVLYLDKVQRKIKLNPLNKGLTDFSVRV